MKAGGRGIGGRLRSGDAGDSARDRARGVLGEGESRRIGWRMKRCEGEEGGRKEERARSVFGW